MTSFVLKRNTLHTDRQTDIQTDKHSVRKKTAPKENAVKCTAYNIIQ